MNESYKRVEKMKIERMKEIKKFFSFLGMHITRKTKLFYKFSKWFPLIFSLMNINESHK